MKTLTETSKCDHQWVTCESKTICLWCGIPKVRKAEPVQRLKIPRAEKARPEHYSARRR